MRLQAEFVRNFCNMRLGLFHMNGMAIEDPIEQGTTGKCEVMAYSPRQNAAVPFKRSRHVPGFDLACPYRKSNPDVLVMQSSQERRGNDAASGLDRARNRCILAQR